MSLGEQKRELKYVRLKNLELAALRDIRQHVVDDIAERIEDGEYNPSRPLRVVPGDDGYVVVDGNHRVSALRQLECIDAAESFPCVVEHADADIYELAHKSNQDEDTYAEEDLFDHLDYISELRDDHTQAEIADRLGWGRSKVSNFTTLLENVATGILEMARHHQNGRVADDATAVADFTEYWFRTSGLYDLNRDGVDSYALPDEDEPMHAQERVMRWFCEDQNCDASKSAVQRKAESVLETCELLERLTDELEPGVDEQTVAELKRAVVAGEYTGDTLTSAIENANRDAQDRALYGVDALDGLEQVESNSIDCVVTDPPYGVDYESHRDTDRPSFPDAEEDTIALLDDVFAELRRVCKDNAHVYVFFSMKRYCEIFEIAERHFDVTSVPLVWAKHNHAPTRDAERGFSKMYAHQYEPILVCRMPNGDGRELNGSVSPNVLKYRRPQGEERYHDSQKPRSLLSELITNSTGKRETVLDPFAGSGATMLAAKAAGRHYVGIERDDTYESRFVRELREVSADE